MRDVFLQSEPVDVTPIYLSEIKNVRDVAGGKRMKTGCANGIQIGYTINGGMRNGWPGRRRYKAFKVNDGYDFHQPLTFKYE